MAMTATPVFVQTPVTAGVQILPADTTTIKTVYTAGANGSKLEMVNIASTDTSSRDLIFYLHDGTTAYQLTYLTVAANSGNGNTTLPLSLLSFYQTALPQPFYFQLPVDAMGNRYITLKAGWSLRVSCTTTVTTAKAINILVQGGDY